VPGTHHTDALTYPLIVVEDSAVITGLAFSSACVTEGRLTNPAAARPIVHLFTFIRSSCDLVSFSVLG